MRIITDTKSIGLIQKAAKEEMNVVDKKYTEIAERIYENVGVIKKFFNQFKYKPSLRFYHCAELEASGKDLEDMKELRNFYHKAWSINNQVTNCINSPNAIISLDSHDSESLLTCAKYLSIDFNSYAKEHDMTNKFKNENTLKMMNV